MLATAARTAEVTIWSFLAVPPSIGGSMIDI
jgi:hypothetical protein